MEEKCDKSSLCCLQAVQTQVWGTPSQSVHSYSPGWKVGGKEQRERDREGERVCVSNREVRPSQSVRQVGSVYWSKGSGSRQAQLPLPGLITRGCAAPNPPVQLVISLPLAYFGKRQTGLFPGLNPPNTKSVCGWLRWWRRGGGAGWGGVVAVKGWVLWDEEEGTE